MGNKIHKYILLLLLLICSSAQASHQESQCKPQYPDLILKFEILPINYIRDLDVNQISKISSTGSYTEASIVGLFTDELSLKLSQKILELTDTQSVCMVVPEVTLTVKLLPRIYISTEVQKLQCARVVTQNHELTHYNNLIYGLQKTQMLINSHVRLLYQPIYRGSDQAAIRKQINISGENLVAYFKTKVGDISDPLQRSMDTPDAYKREWKQCGRESELVSKLIHH